MAIIKFNSAEEFIDALESRREFWERVDADRLAKHRVEEQEYLDAFHDACREALTWDYETAQARFFSLKDADGNGFGRRAAPTCPMSQVVVLDRAIGNLRRTSQKRFNIAADRRGAWGEEYHLLTFDPRSEGSLC